MTAVADPVEMGFVKSLAEPGGNITGVASAAGVGFLSKHLELARDALPFARRVGILLMRPTRSITLRVQGRRFWTPQTLSVLR
jgi:ABC-type uncharacterized transport system substrate-binding protein